MTLLIEMIRVDKLGFVELLGLYLTRIVNGNSILFDLGAKYYPSLVSHYLLWARFS